MKCCGIYAYGNRNYQPQDLCKTSNCGNDAWETETVGGNQRRVLLPRSAGRLTPKKTAATLVAAVFVYGRNKSSIVISFCIMLY